MKAWNNNLDRLIDIRAIASSVLDSYTDTGSTEDDEKLSWALQNISTFIASGAKKRSYLEVGDVKLVRFKAGDTTKFVGTRKRQDDPSYGMLVEGRCCRIVDGNMCNVQIECDGILQLKGWTHGGIVKAERMIVGALHGLLSRKEGNRRKKAGYDAEAGE